jgi:hypothetical protein
VPPARATRRRVRTKVKFFISNLEQVNNVEVEKSWVESGFGGTAHIENECVKDNLKSATSEGEEAEGQPQGLFGVQSQQSQSTLYVHNSHPVLFVAFTTHQDGQPPNELHKGSVPSHCAGHWARQLGSRIRTAIKSWRIF